MSFARLFSAAVLFTLALSPLAFAQKAYTDAEAAQHVGEEAAVTGKVVAVSKSGKGTTFLNFGDRFPRHIFSGVIFARDEEKVGDVKIYEGKVVTLTGRIEQSQDGKPQILINSPTQIKLADSIAAPSAPMPPPAPAPALAPATAPAAPVASLTTPPAPAQAAKKKIALAQNWTSPQGGEMTRKDLAQLFGEQGSPSENLEGDPSIVVYGDVTFLMPLGAAKKKLGLETAPASALRVTVPGLPTNSLTAHTFNGVFPGGFNRLSLITDHDDQVVSVLLLDDNPRQRTSDTADTAGYHTYNFITGKVKGTNELVIKHQIAPGGPAGVVFVESMLVDPYDGNTPSKSSSSSSRTTTSSSTSRSRTGRIVERSRWFVPKPLVNLILRSASGL